MGSPELEFVIRARDEASKVLKKVGLDTKQLAKDFGSLSGAVTVFGGLAAAMAATGTAAFIMAKRIGDAAETLERQSKTAGMTAAQLQAMQLAFHNAGLTGEDAARAMNKLNVAIGRNDPALEQLGITTRDAFEAFQQLGAIFRESDDAAKKAQVTQLLMGRSMLASSGIIDELAAATMEAARTLAAFGAQMDDAAMRSGKNLDEQMDKLNTRLTAATTSLRIQITPALIDFVTWLNRVVEALAKIDLKSKVLAMVTGQPLLGAENLADDTRQPKPPRAGASGAPKRNAMAGYNPGMVVVGYDDEGNPIWGRPEHKKKESKGIYVGGRRMTAIHGEGFKRMQDGSEYYTEQTKKYFEGVAKGLKAVEVPALRLTEAGQLAAAKMDALSAASTRMTSAVAFSLSSAITDFVTGARTAGQAFNDLMMSIVQSIADAAAKLGIGLGLQALGIATGQPWITAIGSGVAGTNMSGAGGTTNITVNTMDSRNLQSQIMSSGGGWRRADARARTIYAAGSQ